MANFSPMPTPEGFRVAQSNASVLTLGRLCRRAWLLGVARNLTVVAGQLLDEHLSVVVAGHAVTCTRCDQSWPCPLVAWAARWIELVDQQLPMWEGGVPLRIQPEPDDSSDDSPAEDLDD
jgi:hypothetical protein